MTWAVSQVVDELGGLVQQKYGNDCTTVELRFTVASDTPQATRNGLATVHALAGHMYSIKQGLAAAIRVRRSLQTTSDTDVF